MSMLEDNTYSRKGFIADLEIVKLFSTPIAITDSRINVKFIAVGMALIRMIISSDNVDLFEQIH